MIRVLELFAGIGGLRSALPECDVVAAVDINEKAAEVYQRNFGGDYWIREIESLRAQEVASLSAELWWMSPPCQPFSIRGNQRGLRDPRSFSLVHVIKLVEEVRPPHLMLENVPGFADSDAWGLLQTALGRSGYKWQTLQLCPTQLGWPNLRNRFYLWASQPQETECRVGPWRALPDYGISLEDVLAADADASDESLWLHDEVRSRVGAALDIVSLDSKRTACFGASYGKSLLHAGSYLRSEDRIRRFSPQEVTKLLGFPASFVVDVPCRTAWKLLGNSLSLPAVRYIASHLNSHISPTLPWIG